eukprot:9431080-Alexandrium_andersonii.AAC.1
MSASLVGSEMCIRDSCCPGGAAGVFFVSGCCASADRPAGPLPAVHGHRPVSYTHLTLPTICSV